MKKIKRRQYSERSDRYILFLAGIYNLIFADISLAGMPLRTLILLLADFLCIAVYVYRRKMTLPHWKECSVYEKIMIVLLSVSVVTLAVSALFGLEFFWTAVDITAVLLIYVCIYGRKSFPQDIFVVYSVCSSVICMLLLCYYLAGGICEPLLALLLQDNAVIPWLVLGITMNIIAYCFQEKGQVWYGGNIVLYAFLLALQKNIPGMVLAGLVPCVLPIFCRPSKLLARRAAQAGALYAFLLCNMSLITGYTPMPEGIVTYDLEVSVYMELLLALVGLWFFTYWDRYTKNVGEAVTVPKMREWYKKVVTACLITGVGVLAAAGLFAADDTSSLQGASQVIINDIKVNLESKSGLFEQMGQRFGMPGIIAVCGLFYLGILQMHRTKGWRVKAHKLYRLMIAVFLLQAVFLPQTMVTLPVYIIFFFLFMGSKEKQKKIISEETEEEEPQSIPLEREEQVQDAVPEAEESQNTISEKEKEPQPQNTVSEEEKEPQNTVSEEELQKTAPDEGAGEKESNGNEEDTTDQVKGENADEADYSDSMLQRGRDIGNRFKRFAKKIGWHRSN